MSLHKRDGILSSRDSEATLVYRREALRDALPATGKEDESKDEQHHDVSSPASSEKDDVEQQQQRQQQPAEAAAANAPRSEWDLDGCLRVLAVHLVYVGTWGLLNAYGSYQEYYSTTRFSNRSDTAIAWIGTVQATLVIVLGVVTGPIYDKGYVRELMLVGAFLTVFGFMMLSLATQYWQVFLAQGVCTGIGSGIIYIPSLALVATSFSKHRALAIAIATSGAATGGIIFPAALESLLPEVGFAWSTRILGFMCLFRFVVGLAILLPRTTRGAKPPRSFFDLMAFTDVPFMLLSIALYFMFLAYWVPFFFIPAFGLAGVGASPRYSVYLLVITNAATVPGRLLSAVIATKLGPSRLGPMSTMLGATICSGILLFGWLGVTSLAGYDVWVVIFGIFIGPLTVLAPTVIPQLCPDENVVGTRMGMAWAASALGILTGAPLASTIIDPKTGKFWPLQVLVGTSMMIGAACLIPVWIHLWRMTRSA